MRNESVSVASSAASRAGCAATLQRITKGTAQDMRKDTACCHGPARATTASGHESSRKTCTRTRVCSANRGCHWCQMETGQQFSHCKIRASEREHGLSRVTVCHGFWRPRERGVELFHTRATFLVAVHLGAWMTLTMAEHKGKHEIDRRARPASLKCKTSSGASMTSCTGTTAGIRSEFSPQHAIETVEETLAGGTRRQHQTKEPLRECWATLLDANEHCVAWGVTVQRDQDTGLGCGAAASWLCARF